MSRPHKIAILSFAHYHANFWAEQFAREAEIDLACIWDDDEERGRDAAGRFATRYEPDLDAALASCEAVAICSQTSRHAELAIRAARADRAILCEKPITTNLADADAILAALRETGTLFMQSFPKRLDPASQALREGVASGRLGRIHLVRIRHGHHYGLDEAFRRNWYADPVLGGGGALIDEGVHGADLLCWLFGLPESVVATTSSVLPDLAVEDGATALFTYADGMTAELTASIAFVAADTSIEIYGTGGTMLLSAVDLASRDITQGGFLRSFIAGEERQWRVHDLVPRFKQGEFHHQNAAAFARCLREGAPPPATAEDGRRALLLIVSAYEAARTGRRQLIADHEKG
ncbi:Gfo/Idh/MocA family oxidoreductase [Bosea sp. LjRoot90]|uniref:Gfo/Idh/MocA family protein n=1 Tax=Bosea sp. LjRoot90 TaxID=3342342 RepID=UPI003ECC598B